MSKSAEKRARFVVAFDSIRDELLAHFAGENMPKEAQEWYKRVGLVLSVSIRLVTR